MKLLYIKANGEYYYPQEPNVQDPKKIEGCCLPVCRIKKLLFGRYQVDYYDQFEQFRLKGVSTSGEENKPNLRLILYPSGIEEIKYTY